MQYWKALAEGVINKPALERHLQLRQLEDD